VLAVTWDDLGCRFPSVCRWSGCSRTEELEVEKLTSCHRHPTHRPLGVGVNSDEQVNTTESEH
jgi:hypothetical protein